MTEFSYPFPLCVWFSNQFVLPESHRAVSASGEPLLGPSEPIRALAPRAADVTMVCSDGASLNSEDIKALAQMKNVKHVSLAFSAGYNFFEWESTSDAFVEVISNWSSLESICLDSVYWVDDAFCKALSRCSRLREISILANNEVSAEGVRALASLPKLEHLELYGFADAAEFPELITEFKTIRRLLLQAYNFENGVDVHLRTLPKLESLALDLCRNVSGDHLLSILECESLRHLLCYSEAVSEEVLRAASQKRVTLVVLPSLVG